jgi:Haem-binding domain
MSNSLRSNILKWSAIIAAVLFVAAQLVRPARTNPDIDEARTAQAHLDMPSEVQSILKRACYDCHSNETVWPWYSNVAPASWFLADHVNHGRKHLNFSDWTQPQRHALDSNPAAQLDAIYKEVGARNMPLGSYLILHPEAKLSDTDIEVICGWAKSQRARLANDSEEALNKK